MPIEPFNTRQAVKVEPKIISVKAFTSGNRPAPELPQEVLERQVQGLRRVEPEHTPLMTRFMKRKPNVESQPMSQPVTGPSQATP
jgi:hypothetical protein